MAGRNSQRIGQISEQAALQGLVEVLGYFGVPYSGESLKEITQPLNENFQSCLTDEAVDRQDIVFAMNAGSNLGKTIATEIFKDLQGKKKRFSDFSFRLLNTGGEDVKKLKTDDIVIELKSQEEVIIYPISLKTKSKTGNKVVGTSSSDNTKFIHRLFNNTPLLELYPEAIEMASDDTYRNLWREFKREGFKPDPASSKVTEVVGYRWKSSAQDKLQKGLEYIFSKPEYIEYRSTVVSNLLSLSGFKIDTHLALALRKKGLPYTTYYFSLFCKKYNDIVKGSYKNITIERLPKGGMKIFLEKTKNTKLEINIDYLPNGVLPYWNPEKTLL